MALVHEMTCLKCSKTKREVVNHTGICRQCRCEESNRAKRTHLASLKGLTVKERLERIEEILYDLNAEQRIKSLELNFVKY